jgi:hypothetical protein
VAGGHVILSDDGGEVTPAGERFLLDFGVDLKPANRGRRMFCQPCLDWSERRYHLRGVVGAGLLCRCLELNWFRRERDSRALRLTPAGRAGLASTFGIELDSASSTAATTVDARIRLRGLSVWSKRSPA